jgi:hypothetical protein
MAHTAGPWTLVRDPKRGVAIQTKFGFSIAYVQLVGTDLEDGLANAQVIVAAPDMFAKLKQIFAGMMCSCALQPFVDGPVPCETCQIGAVIAKAEGRPPESARPCGCDPGESHICERHSREAVQR